MAARGAAPRRARPGRQSSTSAAGLVLLSAAPCAAEWPGELSLWSTEARALETASCGFAAAPTKGIIEPSLTPYMRNGLHCAVSADIFNSGESCGACYLLRPAAQAGAELPVQVTGSGAVGDALFDCMAAAAGRVCAGKGPAGTCDIIYRPVECGQVRGGIEVIVTDGPHDWRTTVLVANIAGLGTVDAVDIIVDGVRAELSRVPGTARFNGTLHGRTGAVSFIIQQESQLLLLDNCFNTWPQPTGAACHTGANFAARSAEATPMELVPSPTPVPAPAGLTNGDAFAVGLFVLLALFLIGTAVWCYNRRRARPKDFESFAELDLPPAEGSAQSAYRAAEMPEAP